MEKAEPVMAAALSTLAMAVHGRHGGGLALAAERVAVTVTGPLSAGSGDGRRLSAAGEDQAVGRRRQGVIWMVLRRVAWVCPCSG